MEDVTFFHEYCALETSVIRPKYTVYWIHRSTAPWYLFDSSMREVGCIDVVLRYLLLEATSEELSKEEALFDCWNRSWIQGLSNIHGIRVIVKLSGMTHWAEPLERPKSMKKNRIVLKKLGLMIRPDGIWLDGLT